MADIPFIIIEDDLVIRTTLENLISKVFPNLPLYLAADGLTGYSLIKRNGYPAIVISDLNMPGMHGLELITKIKSDENLKNIYMIIITANDEKDIALKALQRGADDLMQKPFSMDNLMARLKQASRIMNMSYVEIDNIERIKELEQKLKSDTVKFIDVMDSILSVRLPERMYRIEKIVKAAKFVASRSLDFISDIHDIERAAKLMYIGYLGLGDEYLKRSVTKDGYIASEKFNRIPEFAKELLSHYNDLEECSNAIYHIFENFDGSGFPKNLKQQQIPKSSRILRVIWDYEYYTIELGDGDIKAMEKLVQNSHRIYDYECIALFDQYLANYEPHPSKKEIEVAVNELAEKLMISRNVITKSGLLLVGKNTLLTTELIGKIQNMVSQEGIIGSIYVYDKK